MRNIFNQYSQPENRLSHAFATVLAQCPEICRAFVEDFAGKKVRGRITVVEQTIPGSYEPMNQDTERGLPDICVAVGGEWCLAIESKVGSALTADQIRRHRRTVRRAFPEFAVMAITARSGEPDGRAADHTTTWRDVYLWLGDRRRAGNFWCGHLREYMRHLQALLCEDESAMPAPITEFDGIRFDEDHPYNYLEAKMQIRGLFQELRRNPRMLRLGIDPKRPGRAFISGSKGSHVWDFLLLKSREGDSGFTGYPHFAVGISATMVDAMLTIPNAIRPVYRNNLRAVGKDRFLGCCREIAKRHAKAFGSTSGIQPMLRLSQRHFLGQIKSIQDAEVNADLRVGTGKKSRGIKAHEMWLTAAYEMMCRPNGANMQLEVGVWFQHSSGALVGKSATDLIAQGFSCTEPFTKLVLQQ